MEYIKEKFITHFMLFVISLFVLISYSCSSDEEVQPVLDGTVWVASPSNIQPEPNQSSGRIFIFKANKLDVFALDHQGKVMFFYGTHYYSYHDGKFRFDDAKIQLVGNKLVYRGEEYWRSERKPLDFFR